MTWFIDEIDSAFEFKPEIEKHGPFPTSELKLFSSKHRMLAIFWPQQNVRPQPVVLFVLAGSNLNRNDRAQGEWGGGEGRDLGKATKDGTTSLMFPKG